VTWPFGELRPLSYDLIMADPPWSFQFWSAKGEEKSAQAQYACMSIEDIKALPVSQLARGDALLWLWCTWPLLREAIETVESWGFKYVTGGAWAKRTKHGKAAFGTGYRLRSSCEPFLIGTIGNPETTRSVRNLIDGLAREHSRKPDEAFTAADLLMPSAFRVELFSRQRRPGWDSWGNQKDIFGSLETAA